MKIFNTLTRRKEEFVPLTPGQVKMYVCGPTVYNLIHIGNARPMIVFDTVRRYFEYKGYDVQYVSNFTDVDDKIIKKANEEGVDAEVISKRYIEECKKDMAALNVKPATVNPQATQEIQGMLTMIQTLIDKGHAYVADDGTVYFKVKSFKEYGKLSHKNLDELQSGFRELKVSGEEVKEDPNDFVLWKPKKEGEPYWESPWCQGRPGWHIECSTMSVKHLGPHLDIHCGGIDHVAVHHENEIAQSEAYLGHKWCNCWLHGEFLQMKNDEKMSKSKGNFITLDTLVEKGYKPEAYRYLCLTSHYRSSLVFSYENLDAAAAALKNLYNKYLEFKAAGAAPVSAEQEKTFDSYTEQFNAYLFDDLKTPQALALVWTVIKDKDLPAVLKVRFMESADEVLGLGLAKVKPEAEQPLELSPEIQAKLEERKQARVNKDWAKSDAIRDELAAQGIIVKDLPGNAYEVKLV